MAKNNLLNNFIKMVVICHVILKNSTKAFQTCMHETSYPNQLQFNQRFVKIFRVNIPNCDFQK